MPPGNQLFHGKIIKGSRRVCRRAYLTRTHVIAGDVLIPDDGMSIEVVQWGNDEETHPWTHTHAGNITTSWKLTSFWSVPRWTPAHSTRGQKNKPREGKALSTSCQVEQIWEGCWELAVKFVKELIHIKCHECRKVFTQRKWAGLDGDAGESFYFAERLNHSSEGTHAVEL